MTKLIKLQTGAARAQISPEMGGGIARLDIDNRCVLRPWRQDHHDPLKLASIVLVPFSNRISSGGFEWNGVTYPVERNVEKEEFPIHGDGFQRAWRCVEHNPSTAHLELVKGSIGPWHYSAGQEFVLEETSLTIKLTLTNQGKTALPFGCGFHPWFPRDHETKLIFSAKKVWLRNEKSLPTGELATRSAPQWDFSKPRSLPSLRIDNGFSGWEGAAHIHQGKEAQSCLVEASKNLNTAIVFSPGQAADFFCFEPVSHPIDAFHHPETPGLEELSSHQSMHAWMRISWSRAG